VAEGDLSRSVARAEAYLRVVSSSSVQPVGHNTPTWQTGQERTDRQTTVW